MTFPNVPLDLHVDLLYDGVWNEITPDVRVAAGVTVHHGRPDEASSATPASCALTLDNRAGKYSPRNPVSPLYGKIGRNTPLRVAIRTEKDSFTRTVSSGWGATDTGAVWTVSGAGGSVLPSDFAVAAGVGTQSVPITNGFRMAFLGGRVYRDADVAATVSGLPADVTGAAIEPLCLLVGGVSGSDHFLAPIAISAAEVVTVAITHFDGTVLVAPTTVPITYTGQALRSRFQLDGQSLRAKVWPAASGEPDAWNVQVSGGAVSGYVRNRAPGWVGIRSGIAAGNTNTLPVVFSYDNLENRSTRFAGEVSAWPPRWDTSGREVSTPITAAGIRRRLGQGASALRSALYRGITSGAITRPVAYWPCEDGQNATTFASAFGQPPMTILGGAAVKPASFSGAVASAPIPTISTGGRLDGPVPPYPASNQLRGLAFINVPTGGTGVETTVIRMQTTGGSTESWFLSIKADGALHLVVFANGGANVLDVTSGFALNGQTGMIWIWLQQVGADISWQFGFAQVGGSVLAPFGTLVGHSFGAAMTMIIGQNFDLNGVSVGHVMVLNTSEFWSIVSFINAWANETTTARMARLAGEEGVPLTSRAGPTGSEMLGPQRPTEFLGLLDEGAAADMGILAERRDALALHYRSRSDLYNQAPVLALDYTAGHLAPPLEPADDDQAIRNDVTISRTNGSSFRAVLETGALSIQPAPLGVGRYITSVTVGVASDTQLPDQAGWRRHLGTLDQTRYPVIRLNLAHNPELIPRVAALQLGDRITVANPPVWLAPEPIDVLVQGYSEHFAPFEWTVQLNASPGAGYQVVRLDDTALGKVDTDTSVLTVAATSTATTLVVADAPGPGWTTDPAQMPIPITVAGEAMSVTAVSAEGLSNPNFESTAAPWGVTGGTRTQSSVQKHGGSFAARIVPDGVSTQAIIFSENLPIVPNKPVTLTAWFWFTSAVTANANIVATFLDANQVFVSSSLGTAASVAAATWTQLTQTVTPPPTARYVQVVPRLGGTPAAAQIWYVDDVSLIGGPQTVTVTRSVNGVVKALAAGAAVHLTRPATIAL